MYYFLQGQREKKKSKMKTLNYKNSTLLIFNICFTFNIISIIIYETFFIQEKTLPYFPKIEFKTRDSEQRDGRTQKENGGENWETFQLRKIRCFGVGFPKNREQHKRFKASPSILSMLSCLLSSCSLYL